MRHLPDICISICGALVPLYLLAFVTVAHVLRRAPEMETDSNGQ